MSSFVEILRQQEVVSESVLDEALQVAEGSYVPLIKVLSGRGDVDEAAILKAYADSHGMEFVDLHETSLAPEAVKALSAKLASHYQVVPVSSSDYHLVIATADPHDTRSREDIETALGVRVERVLATRGDIQEALRRYYGVGADTVERILATRVEAKPVQAVNTEVLDQAQDGSDASIIRLVNQLLKDAIADRATDLHFEKHRDGVVVRRRIDGILYDTSTSDRMNGLYASIVSRVKLMANLNIVERRLPQDGRARVSIENAYYDLRVSIVPSMYGEDVVIRILPSTMLYDLEELGFDADHLDRLNGYIQAPHGILFVTGPTGSGKSTTLYACLSRLNSREKKIITIEDPVEYELPGITQTQMNPKIGLTFASALRSMLRHDPDVMMVGEVRDRETAEIAIQTAMTGHLVLSTLHTNDAAGGAARLVDMGIDPYLITSTVQAFMAQRLVRMLCSQCREVHYVDDRTVYEAKGCRACNQSGYRGRVAICEFLPVAADLSDLILNRASAHEIRARANELEYATLREDGERKVAAGITSESELLRVTMV